MSDEPKKSDATMAWQADWRMTEVTVPDNRAGKTWVISSRLKVLLAFWALVGVFWLCFRGPSSSDVGKPDSGPHGPRVSRLDAESIALAEVRKREGWSGQADVGGEGATWLVFVWHDSKSDANSRWVAIDTDNGHIVDYHAATRKQ
jgi:hypothetical protein